MDKLVEVPDNMPPETIAVSCPPPNLTVAPPTTNKHIRERVNGVYYRISLGGVDPTTIGPTTATPPKPPSASDINFAENPKNNNPTPIKAIGVPTPPACHIIYFVDYVDEDEDWHKYNSDGVKGLFLVGIAEKLKDDLSDKA